jgi:hypothetical protein
VIDVIGAHARDHGSGGRAEDAVLLCLTNVNDAPPRLPQEHNAPLPHHGRTSLLARETLPTIEHLRFIFDRSKSRFQ